MTTASESTKRARMALATLAVLLAGIFALPVGATAQAGVTAQVTPSAAEPLEPITIDANGFLPGELVDVSYGGDVIGIGVADGSGAVSIAGYVPAFMPPDLHPMDINGDMGSYLTIDYETLPATMTVPTPPAPPAPPTPAPTPASPAPAGTGPSVIIAPPSAAVTPQSPGAPTTTTDDGDEADSADEADPDGSGEPRVAPGEQALADPAPESAGLPMAVIVLALAGVALASGGLIILLRRRSETGN